jgi:hypothetical protein
MNEVERLVFELELLSTLPFSFDDLIGPRGDLVDRRPDGVET